MSGGQGLERVTGLALPLPSWEEHTPIRSAFSNSSMGPGTTLSLRLSHPRGLLSWSSHLLLVAFFPGLLKRPHAAGYLSAAASLTWKELSSQDSEPDFHPLCSLEQCAVLSTADKNPRLSLHYSHRMPEK